MNYPQVENQLTEDLFAQMMSKVALQQQSMNEGQLFLRRRDENGGYEQKPLPKGAADLDAILVERLTQKTNSNLTKDTMYALEQIEDNQKRSQFLKLKLDQLMKKCGELRSSIVTSNASSIQQNLQSLQIQQRPAQSNPNYG